MANWGVQDGWSSAARNPAQPAGLTQSAAMWAGSDRAPATAMEGAKSWFGGRNLDGPTNGWDTDFYNRTLAFRTKVEDEAVASKDVTKYYNWMDRDGATGVVMWNDEAKGRRAGDVWDNGVKTGNVYDLYDQNTADTLMGAFMFDGREQARMNKDGDPAGAWRRAVQARIDQDSNTAVNAASAQSFRDEVDARQEDWAESGTNLWGSVGAGAGGGALTGSSIAGMLTLATGGAAAPLAPFIIGGSTVVGAIGGWLNRDQFGEVAARAMEKAERAGAERGAASAALEGLKGAGALGSTAISPYQNVVQGLWDRDRGDMVSEYYEPKEDRPKPLWLEAANLGGAVLDGMGTMGSKAAAKAYMLSTGMSAAGSSGQLLTGSAFNESTGRMDDYEGLGENLAAAGYAGIEWLQVGVAGSIARSGAKARAAFGVEGGGQRAATHADDWLVRKADEAWAARGLRQETRDERRAVLERMDASKTQELNGIRFFRSETGEVIGYRSTAQAIVPSEFSKWVPTFWQARNLAAMKELDAGAMGLDDLYRAALHTTQGGGTFTNALVTAYAESVEEAAQAYLEPKSFGDSAAWNDIGRAALYGGAAGFGMAVAGGAGRPTGARIEKERARIYASRREGYEISEAEWTERWNGMDSAQRQRMANADPEEAAELAEMLKAAADQHMMEDGMMSSLPVMAIQEARKAAAEKSGENPAADNTLVLRGQSGDSLLLDDGTFERHAFGADSAVMSGGQAVDVMRRKVIGFQVQARELAAELTAARAEKAEADRKGDADASARAAARIAALEAREQDTRGLVEATEMLWKRLRGVYSAYNKNQDLARPDPAEARRLVATMNNILDSAWSGTYTEQGKTFDEHTKEMLRRAVEFQTTRHPTQDEGSFSVLRMNVSGGLTRLRHMGAVYTHQSLLKTIGGDHDGDTRVTLNFMYIPPDELESLRRGAYARETQVLADENQKKLGLQDRVRWEIEIDPPDNEAGVMAWFGRWQEGQGERGFVADALATIEKIVKEAYSKSVDPANPFTDAQLDPLIAKLKEDVHAGVKDARVEFVNALINLTPQAYSEVMALGAARRRKELPWLMAQFNNVWEDAVGNISNYRWANREYRPRGDAGSIPDVSRIEAQSTMRAANMAYDLALVFGPEAVRASQKVHYTSFLHSAVDLAALDPATGGFTPERARELANLYMLLGSGDVESDMDAIRKKGRVESRVLDWLNAMVDQVDTTSDRRSVMMVLASTAVRDIDVVMAGNEPMIDIHDGTISLLQLLLRRSLEIEEAQLAPVPRDDPRWARIKRLKRMTRAQGPHSYSASLALLEVFEGFTQDELLEDGGSFIGENMTMGQLRKSFMHMSSRDRSKRFENLRKPEFGYRKVPKDKNGGRTDPPYSRELYMSGEVTAYTVLLDALEAVANNQLKNMEDAENGPNGLHNLKIKGFTDWRVFFEKWRDLLAERTPGEPAPTDEQVLDDLLRSAPKQINQLLLDLIPEAARAGTFNVSKDGSKVYMAKWVRTMLLEKDAERAAVIHLTRSKIDEWNAMGGQLSYEDIEQVRKAEEEGKPFIKSGVKYGNIKSRYLQVLYRVAADPERLDLLGFLDASYNAPDTKTLFDTINNNPMWIGNQEKLLAYHDDVSLFETAPSDIFSAGTAGTKQREAIEAWGKNMEIAGATAVQAVVNYRAEKIILKQMDAVLRSMQPGTKPSDITVNNPGVKELQNLERAIELRRLFPDTQGPNSRDQFLRAVQQGLIQMHNKGAADQRVAPFGDAVVLMDAYGVDQGVSRELDAQAALSFDKVLSNPTALVEGPVVIMMPDGKLTRVDLSTVAGALKMLNDPRTNALAKAVLFPTVRDVNNANVLQIYLDVEDPTDFAGMLAEQSLQRVIEWPSGRPTVEQAYRYIGMLEAFVRREALTGTADERRAAYAPIMRMIGDIMVAYEQNITAYGWNRDRIRSEIVVETAIAFREMAKIPAKNREAIREVVATRMQNRLAPGSKALDRMDPAAKEMLRIQFQEMMAPQLEARIHDLEDELQRLRASNAPQSEIDEQQKALDEQWKTYRDLVDNGLEVLNRVEYQSLQNVQLMYAIDFSGDQNTIDLQKRKIVELLGKRSHLTKFRDKSTYLLIEKVRRAAFSDPDIIQDPEFISEKEWVQLSNWCVSVFLSEASAVSGSSVALLHDFSDPSVARYFDRTFTYTVDALFDPTLLRAAEFITDRTNDRFPATTSVEVADLITGRLLNKDKVGKWNTLVPIESLTLNKIIEGAAVGLSIPTAGSDPVRFADMVGASWLTTELPEDEHFSTETLLVPKDGRLLETMSANKLQYVKLQNHFVRSIKISSSDPAFIADNPTGEFIDRVGTVHFQNKEVEKSGLRVMHLSNLDAEIEALRAKYENLGDIRITIDYVDVDKKPHSRRYTNNLYFDGVGRQQQGNASRGPIASLVFALYGLSKIGQQEPLNFATKGGSAYSPFKPTSRAKVEAIEAGARSITELMSLKALHMLELDYETGPMLLSDLPALYKMVKMRHVIRVKDPVTGKPVLKWPEEIIALEAAGKAPAMEDMEVVPLSDDVARALYGASGFEAVPTALNRPVLNIQDLDPFPSLDADRLEALGLSGLGEVVEPGRTALSRAVLPTKSYMSENKGAATKTLWEARMQRWQVAAGTILKTRSRTARSGISNFDIARINQQNENAFSGMVNTELAAPILSRQGIPFGSLMDQTATTIASVLLNHLQMLKLSTNNVIWHHIQDASTSDLANGVLNAESVNTGFGDVSDVGPTFGDVVVIDLKAIIDATSNQVEADKMAKRVIATYAERGVIVALGSRGGDAQFRGRLAQWMRAGSLGYAAVSGSTHVFAPLAVGQQKGLNERALESADFATHPFQTEGITLGLVSDAWSDISENASLVDLEHDPQWRRTSAVIMPVAMTATGTNPDEEYLYNLPKGERQREEVKDRLLELLRSKEGRKFLIGMAKGDKSSAEPKNQPRFIRHRDGTHEPGIRYLEDAIVHLRKMLEAGQLPGDVGTELVVGDLVPIIDLQGNIHLHRHGFEPPKPHKIGQMVRQPAGGKGTAPSRVSISEPKLAAGHTTTPPMIIKDLVTDNLRGQIAIGEWNLDKLQKRIWEAAGFKSGDSSIPDHIEMPGALAPNGIRVTRITSKKAVFGKTAVRGVVDNFRAAGAVFGMDFRPLLIEYFYGMDRPPSDDQVAELWDPLQQLLKEWSNYNHPLSKDQARALMDPVSLARYADEKLAYILQHAQISMPTAMISSVATPGASDKAAHEAAALILVALTQPEIKLEHIAFTPGLLTVGRLDENHMVMEMPTFFTDALDDITMRPALRKHLFRQFNDRLPGFAEIDEQWHFWLDIRDKADFKTYDADGKLVTSRGGVRNAPDYLQYILPTPASENPAGYAHAAIQERQKQTQHVTNVINAAIGGRIAVDRETVKGPGGEPMLKPNALDELYGANEIIRFTDNSPERFLRMLTRIRPGDPSYSPRRRYSPQQELYLSEGVPKWRQYRQPIDRSDNELWNSDQLARANQKADELLRVLGLGRLNSKGRMRLEVDYLVRQFAGRPGPSSDQPDYIGQIHGDLYLQIVELMLTNARDYKNPLEGGVQFILDRNVLQTIYKENAKLPPGERRWAPLGFEGGKSDRKVKSGEWHQWVDAIIGQFVDSNQELRSQFQFDIDAHWHTYLDARPGLGDMPVSFDEKRNSKLLSVPANEALLSLDPGRSAVLEDPIILDSAKQTLSALIGHATVYNKLHANDAYNSDLAKQFKKQREWLATRQMPKQRRAKTKDYMQMGSFYTNTVDYEHQLMKNIVNLSLTMRLFNPALWVSALMEVPVRNMFEHITNILTGRNISVLGGSSAKLTEGVGNFAVGATKALGKLGGDQAAADAAVQQVSDRFRPKYTPREVALLKDLAQQMGQRKEWLAVLYDEMTYNNLVEGSKASKGVSKRLEEMATWTARSTSDPKYGMKGTAVASRYLEAAMEYLTLTQSVISVEQLVDRMSENPLWLRDEYADASFSPHRSGMNRVAQVRSNRRTFIGNVVMSPTNKMIHSGSAVANISGHLLRIPFMFTPFNINALLTITGLNAWDQVAAMFFDNRKKPAFMRRKNADETWDLSEVIETIDLQRTFIRSGATYSMVMMLGMMAGGLGLGGEDEEERRRRRLLENLSLPTYLDPLAAENTFTMADAIFLDDTFLSGLFDDGKGNAVVVPHWVLKQFTSPIIGMQRFFETGNFNELTAGFFDAFSAMPNSVLNLWNRAVGDANILMQQASAEAAKGTPDADANTTSYLVQIVSIYERAIFENQFANAIYQAKDRYDRNPYAIPGVDPETGVIARYPGTNTPMSQDDALIQFKNEDGDIQDAFMSRQGTDGATHMYAANNLTFALFMSLISGQGISDSSFMRQNMVARQQKIELDDPEAAAIEALVMSAYTGAGGQPNLTKREIIQQLKQRDQDNGVWWDQDKIEAEAEALFNSQQGEIAALSILSPEGREYITTDGADGVFTGLANGTLSIGDQSLEGFSASIEVRDEIAARWGELLVQEGLDMGLGYEAASFRADRLWYGEKGGPPGLGDILYSRDIPYENDLKYNQLNMTYVRGPDGKMWATPFPKMGLLQAAGLPLPTRMAPPGPGLALDEQGRIVDLTVGAEGINTGLSGLEKIPRLVADIERNDKAFDSGKENAEASDGSSTKGRPWRRYWGRGGGGGGGGGGGYTPQMRPLPGGTAARFDGIQMINTSNPIIRRANVNTQRIWSERGRLKQWQ